MIIRADDKVPDDSAATEETKLLRGAIGLAQASGLWQKLRLDDRKSFVNYFHARFFADVRRSNATW